MKGMQPARSLYRGVLDQLFPPQCAACRTTGAWLCLACAASLERLELPYCSRCAQPLASVPPPAAGREGLCRRCAAQPLALSAVRAVYLMRGPARQLVHRLKYDGWRALAPVLAEAMALDLRRFSPWPSIIVPVPLHRARQRERGYNQSELLAAELGRSLRIPVERRALVRWKATLSLVTAADVEARRAAVNGAFRWNGAPPAGARVLLVDDVCTTGATLDACASALLAAGAAEVTGMVVAREP